MKAKFQGHESRAAWSVSLMLHNERRWYAIMRQCVKESRTLDDAARALLPQIPARTAEGVRPSLRTVRLALQHWED
jgi:hypothetical protein